VREGPDLVVEEQWMAPRGRSMLGVSRTVRRDTLVEYELVLLRAQTGRLLYEARPSGQPGATFVARDASDSLVIFANPAHDFPQRVGYRRVGAESLAAWIEGVRDGQTRRVDFPYRRAPCGSG